MQFTLDLDGGTTYSCPQPSTSPGASGKAAEPRWTFTQWGVEGDGVFRPCSPSTQNLPTGVYFVSEDNSGMYFQKQEPQSDDLIELDDTHSRCVLEGITKFWASQEHYKRYGLLYKRGVLLYGPAGSGKTALVTMLSRQLLQLGGLVIMVHRVQLTARAISILRRIEPERPLILVFEDIDEIIENAGEHFLLAMLDGELQVNNVVSLATTNFPEKLGARVINRPSRFDDRILVEMPSPASRRKYLQHLAKDEPLSEETLVRWVHDTEGMSVAHLRELFAAVHCLEQPYEEVIERLRSLQVQPRPVEEFNRPSRGFISAPTLGRWHP